VETNGTWKFRPLGKKDFEKVRGKKVNEVEILRNPRAFRISLRPGVKIFEFDRGTTLSCECKHEGCVQ